MRIYVDLTYTIGVDVDHDEYGAATDDELLAACRDADDFALERLHNGPHVLYENDWRVSDLSAWERQYLDALGDRGDGFEVLVRRQSGTA